MDPPHSGSLPGVVTSWPGVILRDAEYFVKQKASLDYDAVDRTKFKSSRSSVDYVMCNGFLCTRVPKGRVGSPFYLERDVQPDDDDDDQGREEYFIWLK